SRSSPLASITIHNLIRHLAHGQLARVSVTTCTVLPAIKSIRRALSDENAELQSNTTGSPPTLVNGLLMSSPRYPIPSPLKRTVVDSATTRGGLTEFTTASRSASTAPPLRGRY